MHVTLKRKKNNTYDMQKCGADEMNILALFLIDDVGSRADKAEWFKKWAIGAAPEYSDTFSSDTTFCYKKDDKIVLELDWDENSSVALTTKQFIHLLEKWHQLRQIKPQEIIISLENGELKIEGNNSNDELADG